MRVGVTAATLQQEGARAWLERAIRSFLANTGPPLLGITTLAPGVSCWSARCVLELGGDLHVVLPWEGAVDSRGEEADRRSARALLARAEQVEVLQGTPDEGRAAVAAELRVAELCDLLLLVSDVKEDDSGDEADEVVRYALWSGVLVVRLDPVRQRRSFRKFTR